jgi:hypothetical protein
MTVFQDFQFALDTDGGLIRAKAVIEGTAETVGWPIVA